MNFFFKKENKLSQGHIYIYACKLLTIHNSYIHNNTDFFFFLKTSAMIFCFIFLLKGKSPICYNLHYLPLNPATKFKSIFSYQLKDFLLIVRCQKSKKRKRSISWNKKSKQLHKQVINR